MKPGSIAGNACRLTTKSTFVNAPHIIRLRGPWRRCVSSDTSGEASTIVQMPGNWADDLGDEFVGTVEYSRFFNRPTGIHQQTRLSLVFHEIVGDAAVSLNGMKLGCVNWPDVPHRFDVTGKLETRNELAVRITALSREEIRLRVATCDVPLAGGLVGEVHLEIG